MKIDKTVKYILFAELLFTLLPIIILIFVRSYENNFKAIFYNTEWSIMALVLFGQSIVKFSSGASKYKAKLRWQVVALVISMILIFGIIPSVTLQVINLSSKNLSNIAYVTQYILFIISCLTFFFVGAVGQKMLDE